MKQKKNLQIKQTRPNCVTRLIQTAESRAHLFLVVGSRLTNNKNLWERPGHPLPELVLGFHRHVCPYHELAINGIMVVPKRSPVKVVCFFCREEVAMAQCFDVRDFAWRSASLKGTKTLAARHAKVICKFLWAVVYESTCICDRSDDSFIMTPCKRYSHHECHQTFVCKFRGRSAKSTTSPKRPATPSK